MGYYCLRFLLLETEGGGVFFVPSFPPLSALGTASLGLQTVTRFPQDMFLLLVLSGKVFSMGPGSSLLPCCWLAQCFQIHTKELDHPRDTGDFLSVYLLSQPSLEASPGREVMPGLQWGLVFMMVVSV